jgi:hypothetical protein
MDNECELQIDTIVAKALRYYQPVVRLTRQGIKSLSGGELRHGRLRGINKGCLRVRYFGTKTWVSVHPIFWEFAPEQIDERRGVR